MGAPTQSVLEIDDVAHQFTRFHLRSQLEHFTSST